ncbi:MAG: acyl-CoA thioesterase [Candidatus Aminicenantes bacterium]|nr:acyl-CoA thioesterase [Candidatus Aminicenantes bacterium]
MKSSPNLEKSSNKYPPFQITKLPFEWEERVRYSETDKMGIAHNKNYFEWFEIGRTEYCRNHKIPYKKIEERGYFLVVVESYCRYKKPLKYDQAFIIRVSLEDFSPKKFVFAYELRDKKTCHLIASGYTIHITVNHKAEVTPLPQDIMDKITG